MTGTGLFVGIVAALVLAIARPPLAVARAAAAGGRRRRGRARLGGVPTRARSRGGDAHVGRTL